MFYGGLGALHALGSMVVMRCDTRIYRFYFPYSTLLLIKSACVNRFTTRISYPTLFNSASKGEYSSCVAGVVSRPGKADALPCCPTCMYELHVNGLLSPGTSGNSAITSPLLNLRKIVFISLPFPVAKSRVHSGVFILPPPVQRYTPAFCC